MITTAEVVKKIIKDSPLLEEGLANEIINISALARFIKPEVEKELMKNVQTGAITMALNRYVPEISRRNNQVIDVFRNLGDITVKSNIIEFTMINSHQIITKLRSLLDRIDKAPHKFITITQGITEVTIITTELLKDEIEQVFYKGDIKLIQENLSSITVQLPQNNQQTPGVYYTIMKYLAWNNINLIDAVSTPNEITIVFSNKDIDKAFNVLNKLAE